MTPRDDDLAESADWSRSVWEHSTWLLDPCSFVGTQPNSRGAELSPAVLLLPMNRFYSLGNPRSNGQLQSLSHYRDQELQLKQNQAAVTEDGSLLEYEALELRIHPPGVRSSSCC